MIDRKNLLKLVRRWTMASDESQSYKKQLIEEISHDPFCEDSRKDLEKKSELELENILIDSFIEFAKEYNGSDLREDFEKYKIDYCELINF